MVLLYQIKGGPMEIKKESNLLVLPVPTEYRKRHEILTDIRKYLMEGDDLWLAHEIMEEVGSYLCTYTEENSSHHYMLMSHFNTFVLLFDVFIDDIQDDF